MKGDARLQLDAGIRGGRLWHHRVMHNRPLLLIAALGLSTLLPPSANAGGGSFYADTGAGEARFIDRHAEGWFWYQQEPEEPEALPVEPSPAVPPPAEAGQPAPPPKPAPPPSTEKTPPILSTAWLRDNLPKVMDRAIDNPTPENVRLYFLLQRVAMDKANAFSDMASRVVPGDPAIDENFRRPIATFAGNAVNQQAGDNSDRLLNELADQTGLWFFYRSDCPYCHLEVQVLQMLERTTGFKVMAVATDGLPLPGNPFPNFVRDTGQAAQLGVQTVPALFLVHPPGQVEPLSQGVVALDDLRQRILVAAVRAGWISEQSFAATKPLATTEPIRPADPPEDASIERDPRRLIAYLRAQIRR